MLGCAHHLEPSDLAVAPVSYQADTITILASLGEPTRRDHKDAGGMLGWLDTWYYPHLVLTFQRSSRCAQIRLLDSAVATSRGVRVGDAVDRVTAAYGKPALRTSFRDTLFLGYDTQRLRFALTFQAVHDTVRTIVIGQRAFVFM
jgi:hypothetical protein